MSVHHYENFPVASWLCPPALRPPITAIYHFARCADDLADEGTASTAQRLADLAAYRQAWHDALAGRSADPRWDGLLQAMATQLRYHRLPPAHLDELLDAFRQDCSNPLYADQAELLDYCRRSANPIGRLLLHLYGVSDERSLAQSDAICTALQLVNFWQDFSVDHPRGRCYLPADLCVSHGVDRSTLLTGRRPGAAETALLATLLDWTETLMHRSAPLVHRVPGRMGWELRLVVQGGLRILEKIRRMNPQSFSCRPTLGAADLPPMLWRALRMRPGAAA